MFKRFFFSSNDFITRDVDGDASSRTSFGSVFCFNVCSLAKGIMSQFVGRCHAVVCVATL